MNRHEELFRSGLRDPATVKVLPRGERLAHCPFHDDHNPSLAFNVDRGVWICRAGCGRGDLVEFIQRARGLGLRQALDIVKPRR